MPKAIQFIHPGPQSPAKLVTDKGKAWNRLPRHFRSFIEARGRAAADAGEQAKAYERVRFWGEWEAEADIVQSFRQPGEPEMCIRPRVTSPTKFEEHQNTDPFVFDGPFIYCVCQQPAKPSLRSLERGDIILFGSSRGGSFLLDTVFVVSSREPYRPGTKVPASAPPSFRAVTDWPLSQGTANQACEGLESESRCAATEELAFYRGATPDNAVGGMFSFAPAIVPGPGRQEFRRPAIAAAGPLKDCLTPTLTQGLRATEVTVDAARAIWGEVVQQVRAESLLLGVSFNT